MSKVSPEDKDSVLFTLGYEYNTASFASFGPGPDDEPVFRVGRIGGEALEDASLEHAVEALFRQESGKVNVRSFRIGDHSGHPFIMGLNSPERVIKRVRDLVSAGYVALLNEYVSAFDGGISGAILHGGFVEFAVGETPRFVERSAYPVPCLEYGLARQLFSRIYGPDALPAGLDDGDESLRIEFSIHPGGRGNRGQKHIIWEKGHSPLPVSGFSRRNIWPNSLSRRIGDKAYGLLMADCLGLRVPLTHVFVRDRDVPNFSFGAMPSGNESVWTRTCPVTQMPGRFATLSDKIDPYALMDSEDPDKSFLVSCLWQQGVRPVYSGACITDSEGEPLVEGMPGKGLDFMSGEALPESLPQYVLSSVLRTYAQARAAFQGPVRFEWVYDGMETWIVQMHCGATETSGQTIVPGEPLAFLDYDPASGLANLVNLCEKARADDAGIRVLGRVGLTSHIADTLRKMGIASHFVEGA